MQQKTFKFYFFVLDTAIPSIMGAYLYRRYITMFKEAITKEYNPNDVSKSTVLDLQEVVSRCC